MNPNPNLKFNIIKGLQNLISDIRACQTREEEVKRIELELDKIRKKFSANKVLTGYDKKKYVWKLIYIYILGYDVDFGHNYAADLITSIKFSEKVTGYIAMSILFKESNSELGIMINSIRNDLLNQNPICQSLALTLAANLNSKELLTEIYKDVLKFLTNFNERQEFTVKKAMIVLIKVIKIKPEIVNSEKWCPSIMKLIDTKYFESLISICNLIFHIILISGSIGFEPLAEKLLGNVLLKMKECPKEYIYYHIKAPWLQIKILQILCLFPTSSLSKDTKKYIIEYVEYIIKKTNGIAGSEVKYSRVYAEYCLFFESVNLIDAHASILSKKHIEDSISILGIFLMEISKGKKLPNRDINTKYLSLEGISKLTKYTTGNKILKDHCNVIISSLHDNDLSIRKKSLELMFLICSEDSVKLIIKEMLLYFKDNEPQLKEDIALKVAILAEKYSQDFKFYIESIVKMIELAGDYITEDIIFRFYQLMTGFEGQEQAESIQKYAVEKVNKLLEKEFVNENAVKLGALLFGEFSFDKKEGVKDNIENICLGYINTLKRHMNIVSNPTKLLIIGSFMKMTRVSDKIVNIIIPILEEYLESWDPELQQRSIEYLIILKFDDKSIKNELFSKMPLFCNDSLNNSILMKKLSQTNKTLFSKTKEGINSSTTSNSQSQTTTDQVIIPINEADLEINENDYNERHPFYDHVIFKRDPMGFAVLPNRFYNNTNFLLPSNIVTNQNEFKQFLTNQSNSGVILNKDDISIECKVKPLEKGTLGAMLEIKTISGGNFNGSNIEIQNVSNNKEMEVLISKVKYLPTSAQLLIKIKILDSFNQPILLKFNGNMNGINLNFNFNLPILINKYLEPYNISIEDYSKYWRLISNDKLNISQRYDSILNNPINSQNPIMDFLKKFGGLLLNLGFKVFTPNDPLSYNEIEASALLSIGNEQIVILAQASFLPSYSNEFRFSLRIKNLNGDLNDKFSNLSNDIHSLIGFYIGK